jgi:putative RNA 2'-phosphotransferase
MNDEHDERRTVKVSKYLSKHLRHQPERIGLTPDPAGWVEIDALITAAAAHGFPVTREELDHAVAANDKQRFAVDGDRIRASQGHSIEVDLGLPPATPPPYLYHGTVARALDAPSCSPWTPAPCTVTATCSTSAPTASG